MLGQIRGKVVGVTAGCRVALLKRSILFCQIRGKVVGSFPLVHPCCPFRRQVSPNPCCFGDGSNPRQGCWCFGWAKPVLFWWLMPPVLPRVALLELLIRVGQILDKVVGAAVGAPALTR